MSDTVAAATIQVPAWLTNEFLQSILRKDRQNDELTVLGFSAKPAVSKGDNYSSDLSRLCVRYKCGDEPDAQTGLLLKTKLADSFEIASIVEEMNSFGIEIESYELILPKVHELLRSIGDETLLAPKCLAADKSLGYLLFEDLSEQDYYMVDRRFGMGKEHFRLTIDALAKWHAATVVILDMDQDPSISSKFPDAQFDKASLPWRKVIENTMHTLTEYTARYPHLSHIGPKLKRQAATIYDRVCATCIDNIDGLRALCHGDLWSNNILFRNAPSAAGVGALASVKLIDFQQVFNGSPCIDLMLLLHGASDENLHQDDWDELLQQYHTVYATTLRRLYFDDDRIPSLATLHMEMLRLCVCTAYVSMMMIGGRNLGGVAEDPVAHYINDAPEDRQFRLDALLHPRCTKNMHYLLAYFDRKGVFD